MWPLNCSIELYHVFNVGLMKVQCQHPISLDF